MLDTRYRDPYLAVVNIDHFSLVNDALLAIASLTRLYCYNPLYHCSSSWRLGNCTLPRYQLSDSQPRASRYSLRVVRGLRGKTNAIVVETKKTIEGKKEIAHIPSPVPDRGPRTFGIGTEVRQRHFRHSIRTFQFDKLIRS